MPGGRAAAGAAEGGGIADRLRVAGVIIGFAAAARPRARGGDG
jgi:hypothetical protein